MTSLKSLSDETLLKETNALVAKEREVLIDVLQHLREIERRRLYSSLKYASLYEYATKCLGYSEDQAYRRIQAARLLNEVPELEEKITDGSLSLTHLSMAQSLFKREEKAGDKSYSKENKIEILEKFENTSKREAEKIVVSLSSVEITPVEKIRVLSDEDVEIRYVVKDSHLNKIERLKNKLAHKYPNLGLSDLMELLVDLGLETWDKSEDVSAPVKVKPTNDKPSKRQIRRNVFKRDKGQCQVCGCRHAVELDHIFPKAMGGEDTEENLRILCRSCNQREAIKVYGQRKMDSYINT